MQVSLDVLNSDKIAHLKSFLCYSVAAVHGIGAGGELEIAHETTPGLISLEASLSLNRVRIPAIR